MNTATARAIPRSPVPFAAPLHGHEKVIVSYFAILACAAFWRSLPILYRAGLLVGPLALWTLCQWETRISARWTRVFRDWFSLAWILPAYWSLEWFSQSRWTDWQEDLVRFDRWLLQDVGLSRAIESMGPLVPSVLETLYLLLYAFPPIALALLYAFGEGRKARKFLLTLLLGTLTAYLLLPLWPLQSPRLAFPGQDLPGHGGVARDLNLWLLDRFDISLSVFPSGHVAVAFSCAFGLFSVMRRQRAVWIGAFFLASLIYLATIYGRYHYAVDGLASMAIAAAAWRVGERNGADAA